MYIYANRKPVYDYVFGENCNVPLFVTVYEIFTNQIKCQKFDLENEGQCQK